MKKIILTLIALALTSLAHAAPYESTFRDDTVEAVYTSPAVTQSTAAIIVDLSNTTTWPHKKTGGINVSGIWVDFDKPATSTGTVKVGVVTTVNSSSGTVKWFYVVGKSSAPATVPTLGSPVLQGTIRAKVVSNDLPFILTNNVSTLNVLYQTDVTLPTASGTVAAPDVGDIVAFIEGGGTTHALTATIHLLYSAER